MGIVYRYWFVNFTGIIWSVVIVCSCFAGKAQPDYQPISAGESLRQFLQTWDGGMSAQYIAAFHDLNKDGTPEAIVYLTGSQWCGSGGCMLLILERDGTSWWVVSKITITRPPIRVLEKMSNGWHNLGVLVKGGGIQPGYEAELIFNGKTYPTNPTIPALRSKKELKGVVVIPLPEGGSSMP